MNFAFLVVQKASEPPVSSGGKQYVRTEYYDYIFCLNYWHANLRSCMVCLFLPYFCNYVVNGTISGQCIWFELRV